MFILNKEENQVSPLERKGFRELGFEERAHLQEWLAKEPQMLGEELLIIQKEFSGFDKTYERLDLLALDKKGNLVVIENKLDDSGRDVTWQALKYASYCSTLTSDEIVKIYGEYLGSSRNAENEICEFFKSEQGVSDDFEEVALKLNKGSQRIILVAAKFRLEVTSTVLWLRSKGIDIKCVEVAPYQYEGKIFIDAEQIIPTKDAEDYQIRVENKQQKEAKSEEGAQNRSRIRMRFWKKLLAVMNEKSDLFSGVNPSQNYWLPRSINGILFLFSVTGKYTRVELYIDKRPPELNKKIFDNLEKKKQKIEEKFGKSLEWERLDDKKASRIFYSNKSFDVFNENDWDEAIEFLVENMIKLEAAFRGELKSAIPNNITEEEEIND